jgi:outer membrane beta-barrel protein
LQPGETQTTGGTGAMSFEGSASSENDKAQVSDTAASGGDATRPEGGNVSDSDILGALGESTLVEEAKKDKTSIVKVSENAGKHPIWAVQRIYVLRAKRIDLQLNFGLSFNDPYIQRQAFNASISYFITEVLGIGISFNLYKGMGAETELNYSTRRATHQVVPINDYLAGGQLNFTYVPIFGKFAAFKYAIFHWDTYVIGGGGFIFTRPTPVIDPEYRTFDYNIKFCFNVGMGLRFFLSRFLGIMIELRDYIYPEELENLQSYTDQADRENKANWYQDEHSLTNNVMLSFGINLLLPFTVNYKLKK